MCVNTCCAGEIDLSINSCELIKTKTPDKPCLNPKILVNHPSHTDNNRTGNYTSNRCSLLAYVFTCFIKRYTGENVYQVTGRQLNNII